MSDYNKDLKDFRLCYVDNQNLYFSNGDAEVMVGDDWDDVPYEHNAEPPSKGDYQWKILRLVEDGYTKSGKYYKVRNPADHFEDNSPYSVYDINKGLTPWITIEIDPWSRNVDYINLYSNTTLDIVIRILDKTGVDYILKDNPKDFLY